MQLLTFVVACLSILVRDTQVNICEALVEPRKVELTTHRYHDDWVILCPVARWLDGERPHTTMAGHGGLHFHVRPKRVLTVVLPVVLRKLPTSRPCLQCDEPHMVRPCTGTGHRACDEHHMVMGTLDSHAHIAYLCGRSLAYGSALEAARSGSSPPMAATSMEVFLANPYP